MNNNYINTNLTLKDTLVLFNQKTDAEQTAVLTALPFMVDPRPFSINFDDEHLMQHLILDLFKSAKTYYDFVINDDSPYFDYFKKHWTTIDGSRYMLDTNGDTRCLNDFIIIFNYNKQLFDIVWDRNAKPNLVPSSPIKRTLDDAIERAFNQSPFSRSTISYELDNAKKVKGYLFNKKNELTKYIVDNYDKKTKKFIGLFTFLNYDYKVISKNNNFYFRK